jgi:hypothetical protein
MRKMSVTTYVVQVAPPWLVEIEFRGIVREINVCLRFFDGRIRGRVSFVLSCFSFFSFVFACVDSERRIRGSNWAKRPHQLATAGRRENACIYAIATKRPYAI